MIRSHKEEGDTFSHLTENIEDYAIILLGERGTIVDWNKGAEKIKGYTAHEVLGKSFQIFYTPEDLQKDVPQNLLQQAAKNGKAHNEGWRLRKDGTKFWASISITAIHKNNQLDGFIKVTRDLSERKKSEEVLLHKNAMLLEAERSAKMFSWTWDIDSDTFGWSESACDIFNIRLDYGLNYDKFIRTVYEEDKELVKQTIDDTLSTRDPINFSFRLVTADREVKDVICIGRAVVNEHDHVARLVGTLQDITEKNNYIRHIEAKNRQLQEIAQIQSHNVRSQIANILGVCEIFDFDNVSAEEKEALIKELGITTKKLDQITRDIVKKTYQ